MINERLKRYLPLYYEDVLEANGIMDAEGPEFDELMANIIDVLDQYFVDTATWGLADWERICDLPTDPNKPLSQRRSVIKSKLRGAGTVTAELVKNVASAYTDGDVTVTEDFAKYRIVITFVSVYGIPPNIDDLERELRNLIPAHLGIAFEFRYMAWDELDGYGWTWADVDALGLDWAAFESYKATK